MSLKSIVRHGPTCRTNSGYNHGHTGNSSVSANAMVPADMDFSLLFACGLPFQMSEFSELDRTTGIAAEHYDFRQVALACHAQEGIAHE